MLVSHCVGLLASYPTILSAVCKSIFFFFLSPSMSYINNLRKCYFGVLVVYVTQHILTLFSKYVKQARKIICETLRAIKNIK
jgi:hypothetical protein